MKKTLISKMDPDNIDCKLLEKYARIIREGGTVIFPTETVYGLGANALDEQAAEKIYKAKGRPSDNPLIVHICETGQLGMLTDSVGEKARLVMERFWPGPVTLIFSKKKTVPYATTGGLDTVAVRMPANNIALELIRESGVPIAAPSANISGRPSPTKGEHVAEQMDGRVDGIILGGDCAVGVESTVIDLRGDVPVILRPGGLSAEEIEAVVGRVDMDPALKSGTGDAAPLAPGMKYTHYSPDAQVYVVKGSGASAARIINKLVKENAKKGTICGVICMSQNAGYYDAPVKLELGYDSADAARNIFSILIEMDKRGVQVVYSESLEEKGLGAAVMNRLVKSAGYRFIEIQGEQA
ncbi:tRNA threonylcarbamoyladenosine biosynthesis protein YwlC [Peptoclostridium acidaminophilum DSM 3953]|uniref:Threonylcarbamoyl-AMP synthase n=1 Tax=Peptoclostridium acidaminophilum DSM 3953 TaxID=1286171 RepID=W8T4E5_PEPAC|nr:L-threonylcarbamoyladenylate synthase [Peptoclostridium acidaminophilum]AHM55680.1 tRNA threonylcarbamoyladenosine biosynthesis protein YwlC [Peptoclostridium acidaminophilum DSM 3953]